MAAPSSSNEQGRQDIIEFLRCAIRFALFRNRGAIARSDYESRLLLREIALKPNQIQLRADDSVERKQRSAKFPNQRRDQDYHSLRSEYRGKRDLWIGREKIEAMRA